MCVGVLRIVYIYIYTHTFMFTLKKIFEGH